MWASGISWKQLSPGQRKYIHERVSRFLVSKTSQIMYLESKAAIACKFPFQFLLQVIGECSSLKGHTREIDIALRRAITNSNYYIGKVCVVQIKCVHAYVERKGGGGGGGVGATSILDPLFPLILLCTGAASGF